MSEHLGIYADGWTRGNAETILRAAAPDYVFDDPNAGAITRGEFAAYLRGLQQTVERMRGTTPTERFMELSEVLAQETEEGTTAWCWWAIPGTPIQGAGLIKVGPEGVLSERITYYTKLPS